MFNAIAAGLSWMQLFQQVVAKTPTADIWHWQCSQKIYGNRREMAYWIAVHITAASCIYNNQLKLA